MIISERAKEIIEYLLDADEYVNISDIAKQLNVTERTIYREMPEISSIMDSCGLQLNKATGKGLQIYGSISAIKRLNSMFEEAEPQVTCTIRERADLIVLHLLEQEDYLKTQALGMDFQTSSQTIRNDVHELKETYETNDLMFIIKKGEGVKLTGTEHAKRQLLSSILLKNIPLDRFYQWMRGTESKKNPFLHFLNQSGYTEIMRTLYTAVEKLFAEKRISISDKEYEEFLILLCIFVKRHKCLHGDQEELGFIGHIYCPAHEIYGGIANLLKDKFTMSFLREEENYLRWIINLYTKRSLYLKSGETSVMEQLNLASELIQKVEDAFHFPFTEDTNLLENMLMHINMAMERILCGMPVNNPLNEDIYQLQPKLYEVVKECFMETFQSIARYVPEDEIGYIVIYFLASMEAIKRQSISILVVCASGMGSSKMLRNRLEREFSELHVTKIISLHKLEEEDLRKYDGIISTIELNMNKEEVLCVSPLLNEQDKEETKAFIRRINKKRSIER